VRGPVRGLDLVDWLEMGRPEWSPLARRWNASDNAWGAKGPLCRSRRGVEASVPGDRPEVSVLNAMGSGQWRRQPSTRTRAYPREPRGCPAAEMPPEPVPEPKARGTSGGEPKAREPVPEEMSALSAGDDKEAPDGSDAGSGLDGGTESENAERVLMSQGPGSSSVVQRAMANGLCDVDCANGARTPVMSRADRSGAPT
jgi:hypothetical protein